MSASLVGSEMCIRDSSCSKGRARPRRPSRSARASPSSFSPASRPSCPSSGTAACPRATLDARH
eukprot:3693621-Alexandrium_andersonii.AAC.1